MKEMQRRAQENAVFSDILGHLQRLSIVAKNMQGNN
jgi:hypothetical protein